MITSNATCWHTLDLERNYINAAIGINLPHEMINFYYNQECTLEINQIYGACGIKYLSIRITLNIIEEDIQGRNHMNAISITKLFQGIVFLKLIERFILVKNHTRFHQFTHLENPFKSNKVYEGFSKFVI